MKNGLDPAAEAAVPKPTDRFATDLFATATVLVASSEEPDESDRTVVPQASESSSSWADSLPKLSRATLDQSSLLAKFPDDLSERFRSAVVHALKKIIFLNEPVQCSATSIAETSIGSELDRFDPSNETVLRIISSAGCADAIVRLGNDFVRSITDRIFGASGHRLRDQASPAEAAIVEFLASKITSNINREFDETVLLTGGVTASPGTVFAADERGAKLEVTIGNGDVQHTIELLLSRRFLFELDNLAAATSRRGTIAALNRAIPSIEVRVPLGSTRLDAASVTSLELGDIVVVEEPFVDWNNGSLEGKLNVYLGAGNGFVISGSISTDGDGSVGLIVDEIVSRVPTEPPARMLSTMDQKEATATGLEEGSERAADHSLDGNELSPAIENLQVRLRVELAGNRMTLRDVNSLRVGQVIDLGRGPNDSVTLITDGGNEPVATGELVDIEGRLGVRLTKVFV